MKKAFAGILVVFVIVIAGCGGGGGKGGGQTPIVPPNNNPSITPLTEKTVVVKPGEIFKAEIKDFTVEAPATAFSAESSVTVSQKTPPIEEKPVNSLIVCTSVEVSSSANVQAAMTVSIKEPVRVMGVGGFTYLLLHREGSSWVKLSENQIGRFIINPADFVKNGPASLAKLLVGRIEILPISTSTQLIEMADDPGAKQKTNVMVIVHGFCDSAESFRTLAGWYARRHQYRKIYAFEYDWRARCFDSAKNLANTINQLKNEGYTLDLFTHSMGAPIGRYAMEHEGANSNVLHYFSVCGAHLGSNLAYSGELLLKLQNDWINRIVSDLPFGWPTINIPSLADMVPSSAFLTRLNNPQSVTPGHADYIFLCPEDDEIVGFESTLAEGVPIAAFTSGKFEKMCQYSGVGTHSSFVKDDGVFHDHTNPALSYNY